MIITKLWIFFIYFIFLPQKSKQYIDDIFRNNCPQGCFCVPDSIDSQLLIITCRWLKLNNLKDNFPKNITKSLTIQCLNDVITNKFYDHELFHGLEKLQELKIMRCQNDVLNASSFSNLPLLRSLYLQEIVYKPSTITKSLLKNFKKLEKLVISKSNIDHIEKNAFCNLPFLQILDLSHNLLSSATLNVNISNCFMNHLIIFDLSNNKLQKISSTEFEAFPLLSQVILSSNNISIIHENAFNLTNLLQHLDLSHNNLYELEFLPDSLFYVNLAQNNFKIIPAAVANLLSLNFLNISKNFISKTTPFSLLSSSIETIDLSNNNLLEIPFKLIKESIETINILNLANNNLNEIKPYDFQNFSHVKEIDLSHNNIQKLSLGVFAGLNELITLKLNNNSIYFIDIDVFNDVSKKLLTLELANNFLTDLPMAIGRLNKVKTINLANNKILKLHKFVLSKIKHLSKLDLSNNNLEQIESYVFTDCNHLSELILQNNKINTISTDSFHSCPKLKKLDLSRNKLIVLDNLFHNINSLQKLNLSFNEIQYINWKNFPKNLLELYVQNNKIHNISQLPENNIKNINLAHNLLQNIKTEQLPSLLEELDMSNNQLKQIFKHTFMGKLELKLIKLQNNFLQTIPNGIFDESLVINTNFPAKLYLSGNPLICNCQMSWVINVTEKKLAINIVDIATSQCLLPLSNKKIFLKQVSAEDYLCKYNQTCEPGCICCQYSNCDCKSSCPNKCNCFHNNNYKINIVKCESVKETEILMRELPMHASHIYLKNINLPILKSHDFIGRTKLTQLYIVSSNLETIEPLAFNTLPNLKVLNLYNNNLKRINGDESFKTQNLQHINIEQNKIEEIHERLNEIMPNLENLYIANNSLTDVPNFLLLNNVMEKLKFVSLSSNPFRCDCSITKKFHLINWIKKNKEKLLDYEKIECVENVTKALLLNDTTVLTSFPPNINNDLFVMPIIEFLHAENKSLCIVQPNGIFGGTINENIIYFSLILIFLLLLFCGITLFFFKHEKKNNKLIRLKNECATLSNSVELSPNNSFGSNSLPSDLLLNCDVFLSYSKADESSIVQHLCKSLESQDYVLCLLHQDHRTHYNNGLHAVSDELYRRLKACQTLIILITKSFLENEWKMVQIRTSHKCFSKMANKKLIAIIDDNVRTNELDNELGKILRKNTCIQRNHHFFWNLLMSSLPRRESLITSETSQIYSDATYGNIVPSEIV